VSKKKNQINQSQKTHTNQSYNQKTQQYSNPYQSYSRQRHLSEKDIFKSPKKSFHIFNRNHEIDCGLDERIFGPRNQHKDVF
jgi:hypothetical protein